MTLADTTQSASSTTSRSATKPGNRPGTRKVTIGSLGGALVTVVFYGIGAPELLQTKPELVAAATTLVTAFLVYMTTETYS